MSTRATLIIAAALSLAALSGCVDGGQRYGGGYRSPGPVVIDRNGRPPEYERRDDRGGRHRLDRREATADRRGPAPRDVRSRDRREDARKAELCRRDPRARECQDGRPDRNRRY